LEDESAQNPPVPRTSTSYVTPPGKPVNVPCSTPVPSACSVCASCLLVGAVAKSATSCVTPLGEPVNVPRSTPVPSACSVCASRLLGLLVYCAQSGAGQSKIGTVRFTQTFFHPVTQ